MIDIFVEVQIIFEEEKRIQEVIIPEKKLCVLFIKNIIEVFQLKIKII